MIQGLVGLWFTPARGAGQDTLSIRRRTVLRGVYYYVVYNIGLGTGCCMVILLLVCYRVRVEEVESQGHGRTGPCNTARNIFM
jgi:hypothetical protein